MRLQRKVAHIVVLGMWKCGELKLLFYCLPIHWRTNEKVLRQRKVQHSPSAVFFLCRGGCGFQREEASSREAARKRGEGFQRESNRLRQDKVIDAVLAVFWRCIENRSCFYSLLQNITLTTGDSTENGENVCNKLLIPSSILSLQFCFRRNFAKK